MSSTEFTTDPARFSPMCIARLHAQKNSWYTIGNGTMCGVMHRGSAAAVSALPTVADASPLEVGWVEPHNAEAPEELPDQWVVVPSNPIGWGHRAVRYR